MAADLAAVRAAAPGPAGSLVLHVAGGVHATTEPQHVLDYGWDLAAIGEGEATILALVPALRDGAELTGVPGLAVRDDDGVAPRTPQAPQLPLGAFPSFPSGRLRADGRPSPASEPGRAQRKPATIRGTHKGRHCQEGVRIWPGDYARRRAGLTVLQDPSSPLPSPSRRAARSQAGAPGAAQRRGRTSLTPASGGRSSRAGKGPVAVGLSGVARWFPVRSGRSGLTSTHSAPPSTGGCHDHVSGTGLLSHVIERGAGAGSCRRSELTRGLATLPFHGRRSGVLASAGSISDSRCQARVTSLRAIAMVAIFLPRRLAMLE